MAVEVYPLLARGVFATFGYFVIDGETGRGVLVDPGAQPGLFLSAARERDWKIDAILLTHGHFDHMGAAGELRDAWSAPVRAHELADRYLLDPRLNLSADHGTPITLAGASKLSDGDRIPVGGIAGALEVLHVPGHTDDSCAFWCEQEASRSSETPSTRAARPDRVPDRGWTQAAREHTQKHSRVAS
ncbi:MBL fold metallo-hydrolase [Parafannyhessea umbonata]|uniref:Metallo-beta-lactamase superfamily protein n=1 Tax=Parafannyhessea umbonata TaxID=604330 RepID=A0A1H1KQX2_9ACTN|nr:MBL fold metallo-hydrolase [Parafannyhessea umbonata]SDR64748.1 Metallo-beta-lactamase superfamily protein [Parafannyhessea umbonata]